MATAAVTGEDLFKETREKYEARLEQIEPLVHEAEQIRAHLEFMEAIESGRTPRFEAQGHSSTGRRGRPRGGGTRMAEFVEVVQQHPGLTIGEIADRMGIKSNYLYRIGPEADEGGLVRKDGRRYFPVEGKPAEKPAAKDDDKEKAAA